LLGCLLGCAEPQGGEYLLAGMQRDLPRGGTVLMSATERIGHEPIQKPGKSKQDYGTPWALIHAIEERFGKLTIDLAATWENKKSDRLITPEADAFMFQWGILIGEGIGWLNPPFGNIGPWAQKAAACGASVIMLTPASIGAEWFAAYVESTPIVGLRPRLTFEGCEDPYPKDCMLILFGPVGVGLPLLSTWRWR
jgi:phage N-6-adenine-methyltransferase